MIIFIDEERKDREREVSKIVKERSIEIICYRVDG